MRQQKALLNTIVLLVFLVSAAFGAYKQAQIDAAARPKNDTTIEQTKPAIPQLADAKCHMRGPLPDPICTPGSIDPAVTDDNVASTICQAGYTASIRPASSYTSKLKRQQMIEYGFSDSPTNYEEDHLISLQLGGSPADPTNLWPQPDASPNPKDAIENFLRVAVCAGRISLSEAQERIATDWTTADRGLRD